MDRINCPTCDARIEPEPLPGATLANSAMWVCAILLAVAACVPILGLFVLPMLFLASWGLGASASRLSTFDCPVCHAELARPSAAPTPTEAPLVPQHA